VNKFKVFYIESQVTAKIFYREGGGKIAALLQAFGLSVGSCGLANVLQCAMGLSSCVFFVFNHSTNCRSERFFNLAANIIGFYVQFP